MTDGNTFQHHIFLSLENAGTPSGKGSPTKELIIWDPTVPSCVTSESQFALFNLENLTLSALGARGGE